MRTGHAQTAKVQVTSRFTKVDDERGEGPGAKERDILYLCECCRTRMVMPEAGQCRTCKHCGAIYLNSGSGQITWANSREMVSKTQRKLDYAKSVLKMIAQGCVSNDDEPDPALGACMILAKQALEDL